jgi:hypothetical protein
MIKELIILAQAAVQSPPNIMDSNQVPVYSWERPSQPPRYQQPRTGIFMQSGSTPPPVFEEIEE